MNGQTSSLAKSLAENIRQVAQGANTEEDLRIGVEKLLEPALKELGISVQPRYEKRYKGSVLRGSSDAVYGHAIIEYERPGRLSTTKEIEDTAEQLQRYLTAEVGYGGKQREALRRVMGIGLDGYSIFFLRYRGDKQLQLASELPLPGTQLALFEVEPARDGFQLIGPYPVTEDSVSLFLLYLRALRRRPLSPEALAEEFGPKGGVAAQMVTTLYDKLLQHCNPRIETFFSEWDRTFGIVYGQDLAKANRSALELARVYGVTEKINLKPLLFTVHTYYALLMKLLAAEFASLQAGSLVSSLVTELLGLSSIEIRDKLSDLEDGGLFNRLGIRNFLEGDFFGWYVTAWDEELAESVREMARLLSEFEPATSSLEPEATRDLLKRLYQCLVPRELRHDLGEYYTPDWLAELVLNEVGYSGNPDEKVIDPACGSGTFLVLAIRKIKEYADECLLEAREVANKILANVVGFDLNPLAVISARTNYLLALGNLARYKSPLDIPIYLCDSILTPAQTSRTRPLEHHKDIAAPSVVGDFWMPEEIVDSRQVDSLSTIIEDCVRRSYSMEEFLQIARRKLDFKEELTRNSLAALFEKIVSLESEGRNGIWARILKNAFAPLFVKDFDYVVGNPPWVRWGYLADEYRKATQRLWVNYGLFSLKGMAARLGAGEKDFSMLFLYACADAYLKEAGRLGFVITQEIFKAKGAGEGFRRFRLGTNGSPLKVIKAADLVRVKPFEGAANKTAMIILEKGSETTYPLSYTLWQKKKGVGNIDTATLFGDVLELTEREELQALPIGDKTTAWQTVSIEQEDALAKIRGEPTYKAYRGASTEPYGVFWLKFKAVRSDGLLVAENLPELGKRDIRKLDNAVVEPDLVYPAVRGRDIRRWGAYPEIYVLIAQDPNTREGYLESRMKVDWPETYGYLLNFKDDLLNRGSRTVRELAERTVFYTMYGIGTYTFAPYKVVWKRMADDLVATVISSFPTPFGNKLGIATDTTSLVSFDSAAEAHYVCALLNSSPARAFVHSFSSAGRGFGAPSIISHIALLAYDLSNILHERLSSLSQRAHEFAAQGKAVEGELGRVEEEIDYKAAELWGITKGELEQIQASLKEIG